MSGERNLEGRKSRDAAPGDSPGSATPAKSEHISKETTSWKETTGYPGSFSAR